MMMPRECEEERELRRLVWSLPPLWRLDYAQLEEALQGVASFERARERAQAQDPRDPDELEGFISVLMGLQKGGPEYIGRYPYDGYEEAKPHIFARDGYVCQRCGRTIGDTYFSPFDWRTYTLTRADFMVHHINEDKTDQRWVNLEALDQPCHRKEGTHHK